LCKRLGVPHTIKKVKVVKRDEGLEAAARAARYEAFKKIPEKTLALAHNLDDQAETVLMNLLRGAGVRGARGMLPTSSFKGKTFVRPLLGVSREEILAYARKHRLEWIEDESNADEALTRNFIRRSVGRCSRRNFRSGSAVSPAPRRISRRRSSAGTTCCVRTFVREA
jgi:tRNA(Ile)-lysidine synthase